MNQKFRISARRIATAVALAGITLLTAKFAVLAPLQGLAERAAHRESCRVVWAGVAVDTAIASDPDCSSALQSR